MTPLMDNIKDMQKLFIGLLSFALLWAGPTAYATEDSALLLSDGQIALVRQNCTMAQAGLERILANDGLLRVNLGQQFESISSRLMTPMNGRIALNKLDGIDLAKTTVDYNKELDTFRKQYQEYKEAIEESVQMNCADKPVGFYDQVALARKKRAQVRESVVKLQGYVKQYGDQFTAFAAKLQTAQKDNGQKHGS